MTYNELVNIFDKFKEMGFVLNEYKKTWSSMYGSNSVDFEYSIAGLFINSNDNVYLFNQDLDVSKTVKTKFKSFLNEQIKENNSKIKKMKKDYIKNGLKSIMEAE